MTIKIVQRDTCPVYWYIGSQCRYQNEILELVEIDGDEYIWMDVEVIDPARVINE